MKPAFSTARQLQENAGLESGFGLQVEFESFPEIEIAFDSLARERSGIELLNARHDGQRTYATVFVPDGKLAHFENVIQDYIDEKKDRAGRLRDHQKLVNTIRQIRLATLHALWTDDPEVFPDTDDESFWWEVWLPVREDRIASVVTFRRLAEMQGFQIAPGELNFPERIVLIIHGSAEQMARSIMTLNSIAELRRAKETAYFFDDSPLEEQADWLEELMERCRFAEESDDTPHVCLLDTGINNGHPFIGPAITSRDLHTVNPAWGKNDDHGHGTALAGLSLVGDLTDTLDSSEQIEIGHRLESVKLLSTNGDNPGESKHHGYLTIEAVARPEVTAPNRRRVFSMAVTARDNRDRGRPSAWSATLDRLAADAEGDATNPRLIIVSAGNISDPNAWAQCPHSNSSDGIHDPAQAWNALTVGAYTELVHITEPDAAGYLPIAPAGGLSPFSTTSCTWQPHWPLKPDVVFEGGNAAKDEIGAVWMPSLCLLTTHHLPTERMFTTANATSAATALASRMAAQIMTVYPELKPETVRGLIVHSADWTDAMRSTFLTSPRPSKSEYTQLVRHCGYGVPNLHRALWSVSNSLTLIVESSLHPFQRHGQAQPKLRDMNLHQLPWPLEELESLGETQVEMRVTLSYFIEPNPSERWIRTRYRYESHGLRFDVKRPYESGDDFRSRINAAARDEETGSRSRGEDSGWLIGPQNRHKGALHSDIWKGAAADLASRGILAVYPALGWWKTRTRLERYDRMARYSLIVSIHAPEIEVELYNAIKNKISVQSVVDV
ncbi:S8 family peptidase [Desulfatitalea tepidiphila]|uniref:S8 family peptidase n=1 Tax=Desulfatitalea tepidiphila TaxID=1185843 RepID=UPI001F2A6C76|nr:S8 family peptidase [Desulfatitalea tepidiphila]